MAEHALIERFGYRLGGEIPPEDLSQVNQLIEDAGSAVCDLIGRDEVPPRLIDVQVELALIAYNRRGAEGESSRSEGGISRSFEGLSPLLLKRLQSYPRKVGVVHAADEG